MYELTELNKEKAFEPIRWLGITVLNVVNKGLACLACKSEFVRLLYGRTFLLTSQHRSFSKPLKLRNFPLQQQRHSLVNTQPCFCFFSVDSSSTSSSFPGILRFYSQLLGGRIQFIFSVSKFHFHAIYIHQNSPYLSSPLLSKPQSNFQTEQNVLCITVANNHSNAPNTH